MILTHSTPLKPDINGSKAKKQLHWKQLQATLWLNMNQLITLFRHQGFLGSIPTQIWRWAQGFRYWVLSIDTQSSVCTLVCVKLTRDEICNLQLPDWSWQKIILALSCPEKEYLPVIPMGSWRSSPVWASARSSGSELYTHHTLSHFSALLEHWHPLYFLSPDLCCLPFMFLGGNLILQILLLQSWDQVQTQF